MSDDEQRPAVSFGDDSAIGSASMRDIAGHDVTTNYGAAFSEVLRFLEQEAQFRRLLVESGEQQAEHLSNQIESLDKRIRHNEQDLDLWRELDRQKREARQTEWNVWMRRTNARIAWMMAIGLVLMLMIVLLLAWHIR